jgi:hypothetical protein
MCGKNYFGGMFSKKNDGLNFKNFEDTKGVIRNSK